MSVVANVRVSLSPLSGTRQVVRPDVVPPVRRRPTYTDGRRPARLAAASPRPATQQCAPRPLAGSIGWLVVVGVLAFLVVLGIGWSMGGAPDAGSVPTRTVLVQVHQGETLWSVAQRMAPSSAPTAVVAKIRQLNSLDVDSVLYPGELLKVPTGLTAAAAAKAGAVQR
ncbi:MAG TPA: LysM domain-containing protein [Pseudonocardiaceae bacterium]|nr:LysM domain-containing protein [Pseudonocardiaceae bacterium]